MSKPKKSKKMSFGKKALVVGAIGGVLIGGLAWVGAFESKNTIIQTSRIISEGATAEVTIDVYDILATGNVDTNSSIYVYSAESGVDKLMTSGVAQDLTIGSSYTAYVLSTGEYGSEANLISDISSIVSYGEGFKFTVLPTGNSFDLEVYKLGDMSIKAEDSSEDAVVFVAGDSGYQSGDTLTFDGNATTGQNITITDGFEFTIKTRFTNSDDEVINDNGMLIVVDIDDDEFEDISVTYAGKNLKKVDVNTLSEADADAFEKKDVFLLPQGNPIGKQTELIVAGTLIDDAIITEDVIVHIYSRGYDQPASGVPKLTTVDSDGNALYTHNHKTLTFNLT